MTIAHLRRLLYRFNRFLGDVQAVRRGRVRQRRRIASSDGWRPRRWEACGRSVDPGRL